MMTTFAKVNTDNCKVPKPGDKVYKDECIFSFDNPSSEHGIYISLKTFVGIGKKYVEFYHKRTDTSVFLNYRVIRRKKKIENAEDDEEKTQAQKRTRLALGVEGGFALDESQFTMEEHYTLVVMPGWETTPWPVSNLPDALECSVKAVIAADSARRTEELELASWDGSLRAESHEAKNLKQLDNGVRVPPSGWKCAYCDLRDNLWLNLTDGTILCGRRFWDGSGGNNHAVDHFKETGYPLAVKLGTITPEGADVFSYTEDDMVVDPLLSEHLAHFGIDVMKMQKTDKSMIELEIDLNEKFGNEWRLMQEDSGVPLTSVYGPGFTGIHNLGNSCYINSSMQVLFSIPEFIARYNLSDSNFEALLGRHGVTSVPHDFGIQMTKLGRGLCSGHYSHETNDDGDGDIVSTSGIFPYLFKSIIGRDHREFATKKQQDALEFILYLFELMSRQAKKENPSGSGRDHVAKEVFGFTVEDRLKCLSSQRVSYQTREEYVLQVPIPMEKSVKKQDERPRVALTDSLAAYFETAEVDDFYSSAVQARVRASKRLRLSTFPRCLLLQSRRFLLGDDWVPKKLDVALEVPDILDLSAFKSTARPPDEVLLEEMDTTPAQPQPVAVDEKVLTELAEMGFSLAACRKAVIRTNNTGLEAAMSWVMEHMGDSDFDEPEAQEVADSVPSAMVETLTAMGFTEKQARKALRSTDNNVERAVEWLFSHTDDTEEEDEPATRPGNAEPQPWNGSCRYELFALVSHMGTSTQTGHYVCHVKKDGRWILFNDEKVAVSEKPPRDLAYLYFYRRVD